jgi:hypothetical protein
LVAVRTKIDLNWKRVMRLESLDELAEVLFPGNRRHQRVFLAVFVELKYAEQGFMPSLALLCHRCGFSERTLEIVRAKMHRLGLIERVSRFSPAHGHRDGWVLSTRFERALRHLDAAAARLAEPGDARRERIERELHRFV